MTGGLKRMGFPLLCLVGFNLLPQIQLRQMWITLLCCALLGYRFWLEYSGRRLPPRPVLWILQVIIGLAIWRQFPSFFGDEAGGALLTLLTCLKIYELNRKRDF